MPQKNCLTIKEARNKGVLASIIASLIAVSILAIYSPFPYQNIVKATSISWTGAVDTAWETAGNWSGGAVPGTNDDVTINTNDTISINAATTIKSLTLGGSNNPILQFAYVASSDDPLSINSGNLTVNSGATIAITSGTPPNKIYINVQNGNATISGTINVNGKGSAGGTVGNNGTGTGAGTSSGAGGGGGYGGAGGDGYNSAGTGGSTAGSATNPLLSGSGGGGGTGINTTGGHGGGYVRLNVVGNLTLSGTITADGNNGGAGPSINSKCGGGGSGGGIYITTEGTFSGNGTLSADGGAGGYCAGFNSTGGGGGGGGRIRYEYVSDSFTASGTITVNSGAGGDGNGSNDGNAGSNGSTTTKQYAVPNKPIINSPTGGETNVSRTPTIQSADYSGDLSMTSSLSSIDWDIATDNTFTNIVAQAVDDTSNGDTNIQIVVNPTNFVFSGALTGKTELDPDTSYFVRVTYTNAAGNSTASTEKRFTTELNVVPIRPSITAPTPASINQSRTPTITSSAFSDSDPDDTHQSTRWVICDNDTDCADENGSDVIADSGADTVNKTSIVVNSTNFPVFPAGQTKLSPSTSYYVRVLHTDSQNGNSLYSNLVKFTTEANVAPNKPSNPSPSSGTTNAARNQVVSFAFSDDDPDDTHQSSTWRVYTDASLSNLVAYSENNTSNKTSISLTSSNLTFQGDLAGLTILQPNTTYFITVVHTDSQGGSSEVSDSIQITTGTNTAPNTPTISISQTTNVDTNPTLTSSAFSDPDTNDTHTGSDWAIYDSSNLGSDERIWFADNSSNLESITVNLLTGVFENSLEGRNKLLPGNTYYARVLHMDAASADSDWSQVVSFTTLDPPADPTLSSLTHPVENTWFKDATPEFTVNAGTPTPDHYHYRVNKIAAPTKINVELGTQYNTSDGSLTIPEGTIDSNGIWYVHIIGHDANENPSENFDTYTILYNSNTPTISNISNNYLRNSSVQITWDTLNMGNSQINYGTESGIYTSSSTDDLLITNHSIFLSALNAETTYYYTVTSTDSYSQSDTSTEQTFTTTVSPAIIPRVGGSSGNAIIKNTPKNIPSSQKLEKSSTIQQKTNQTTSKTSEKQKEIAPSTKEVSPSTSVTKLPENELIKKKEIAQELIEKKIDKKDILEKFLKNETSQSPITQITKEKSKTEKNTEEKPTTITTKTVIDDITSKKELKKYIDKRKDIKKIIEETPDKEERKWKILEEIDIDITKIVPEISTKLPEKTSKKSENSKIQIPPEVIKILTDTNVSRCEMVKMLAEAFYPGEIQEQNERPFIDIPPDHPLAGHLAVLKEAGIIEGYENGAFICNQNINRAEAYKVIIKIVGYFHNLDIEDLKKITFIENSDLVSKIISKRLLAANFIALETENFELPYADITTDDWFEPYVTFAYNNAITTVPESEEFNPEEEISMEEMLELVANTVTLLEEVSDTSTLEEIDEESEEGNETEETEEDETCEGFGFTELETTANVISALEIKSISDISIDETTLADIAKILSESSGLNIIVDEEIATLTFNIEIGTDTAIEDILNYITGQSDLIRWYIIEDTITIASIDFGDSQFQKVDSSQLHDVDINCPQVRIVSTYVPECGNGFTDTSTSEECDDAGESSTCTADCHAKPIEESEKRGYCGDGIVQSPNDDGINEACDQGKTGGDDCNPDCSIKEKQPDSTSTFCGDGIVQTPNDDGINELCDQGENGGESCNPDCSIKEKQPDSISTFCGDGIVQSPNDDGINEACDQGQNGGDDCNSDCSIKEKQPDGTSTFCGDGIVQSPNDDGINELCDDGNTDGGDGCASQCIQETTHVIASIMSIGGNENEESLTETTILTEDEKNDCEKQSGIDDNDHDGLSNELECYYKTDIENADSDNDGLTDGDEIQLYGTDPKKMTETQETKIPKDLLPSITNLNPKITTIISDDTPLILGKGTPGKEIYIIITNANGISRRFGPIKINEQGNFLMELPSLYDGVYSIALEDNPAKSYTVMIRTDIAIKTPNIIKFDGKNVQAGRRVEIKNPKPYLTGETDLGYIIIANWESAVFASALIADAIDGRFVITSPKNLDPGNHRVWIYAIRPKDNVRSAEIKLDFEVKASLKPVSGKNAVKTFIGVFLLLILIRIARWRVQRKKTGPTETENRNEETQSLKEYSPSQPENNSAKSTDNDNTTSSSAPPTEDQTSS